MADNLYRDTKGKAEHGTARYSRNEGRSDRKVHDRRRRSRSARDSEDEERAEKRCRREEKRMRKELRRLRRAARESIAKPYTSNLNNEQGQCTNYDKSSSEDEADSALKLQDSGIFVWKKKNEMLRKQGIRVAAEDEMKRKKEIEEDLQRAKIRRTQREAERAEWEAEQARQARDREQAENADWHNAEQSFLGSQHLLRQAIRLRQGRPTDADQLARNMRLDLLDVSFDSRSPAEYLDDRVQNGITAADVDMLLDAVETELDCLADFTTERDSSVFSHRTRLMWWTSTETFLKGLARSLREQSAIGGAAATGLNVTVRGDVDKLLTGKTKAQLQELEQEMSDKLAGGSKSGTGTDSRFGEVDFWTATLRSIRSRLARATLRELSDAFAREKSRLRAAEPKRLYENAQMKASESRLRSEDDLLRTEKARGMGADEEIFDEEAAVPEAVRRKAYVPGYIWNDKYRPRKPRYYNRVHTGYDWTKYNRTHYDHNNPPPKTVQGYKFNIFYPDLIDKSTTPSFSISKTDNPEVCIITFTSGPPYEDIAFKIVNRQWEQSHRKGYRCSFDRGILHLWFNFQRYRYRR